MSDLMLDVDQAGELKAAFRRGGWTNAEIKKACEGEFLATVRKLLHGELTIKLSELIRLAADVTVSAITKFTASKAFVVNVTTAKVKIAYLGENFKTNFLGKVEKNIKSATLVAYQLVKDSLDQPILDQLGGKAETTLAHFYELLSKQPNGEEKGILLVNGRANIFYIKDKNGKTWAVCAHWSAGYGGWAVHADPAGRAGGWCAGHQVFAHK